MNKIKSIVTIPDIIDGGYYEVGKDDITGIYNIATEYSRQEIYKNDRLHKELINIPIVITYFEGE